MIELAERETSWCPFQGRKGCWTWPFRWAFSSLLSPVIVLIVVMILLEGLVRPACGGPIFLSEPRGSEGRVFRIPKFRIIRMDAYRRISSEQKYLHIKPMERVPENLTTVGRFLKKVYLDELPQLLLDS